MTSSSDSQSFLAIPSGRTGKRAPGSFPGGAEAEGEGAPGGAEALAVTMTSGVIRTAGSPASSFLVLDGVPPQAAYTLPSASRARLLISSKEDSNRTEVRPA